MIMTTKQDLTGMTFCIPVRIDSTYRLQNLLSVLHFYTRHLRTHFLVLEADNARRIKGLPQKEEVQHIFVEDHNPYFHRTRYINQMLRMAKTPVAAVWDTDAIAPVPQLHAAYRKVLAGDCAMAYPYDGRFWSVTPFFSALFNKLRKIKILTDPGQPRTLLGGFHSVGGAFLVHVERYRRLGWENEHFAGWGPEDVERYHRLEILGETPARVDGGLYHLFHTRGINSGDFDPQLALSTKKEYAHVCSMMPDELRAYIDTWDWIK